MEKTECNSDRDGKDGKGAPREITVKNRYIDACIAKNKLEPEDCEKVLSWVKKGENFLIYGGAPGCGKTHLCHAIEKDARKFKNYRSIRHWEEKSFFGRLRRDMELVGDYNDNIENLMDDDLIIYDDLGSVGQNEWRNSVLLSFIDFRYTSKKPTVITTNLTMDEIFEKIGRRVHSRLLATENTILSWGMYDLRRVEKDEIDCAKK